MSKFRKKPVVIEAKRWFKNGDHPNDYINSRFSCDKDGNIIQYSGDYARSRNWEGDVVRYFRHPSISGKILCEHCQKEFHIHGWIDTLEGGHKVCPGDWIITGVKDEYYPCKPDIFDMTYDPIENE